MEYFEKIALLSEEDFFNFFEKFGAQPRFVTSAGKRAIQILGLCHHGENHSVVFDPDTLKATCFSLCGGGLLFHTYVARAMNLSNPQDAKDFIEDWIENQELDLSDRVGRSLDFQYKERAYEPTHIEKVPAMDHEALSELNTKFDNSIGTLGRLVWCHGDGIKAEILQEYGVSYYPETGTIILPHHNIDGEVVGLYERSFKPLRKEVKKEHPDLPYKELVRFPRAKYVPMLRDEQYRTEKLSSWSFPNSLNLYGLHIAAPGIAKSKKAIIFEGGKSVMLAHQFGYDFAVATHTFGAHLNHISMLIEAGAEEIILAFDRQYREEEGSDWELYEKKTRTLAAKVGKFCQISRIRDTDHFLEFKDAPIDQGEAVFRLLYNQREMLSGAEEKPAAQEPKGNLLDFKVSKKMLIERERIRKEEAEFIQTIPFDFI